MMRLLTATAMCLLGSVCTAPAARAVDYHMTFSGEDGKTLIPDELDTGLPNEKCGDIAGHPCLTLGTAIFHALVRPYQDENPTGEEKYRRGELAEKVKKEGALGPQDIILVKQLVGKLYSPLIVRQAYQALDPSLVAPK